MEVSDQLFALSKSPTVVHQAVVHYLAGQRSGNASAKTRAEVRGGGAKPWRQKGTGRARAGSIRSPLWRGGGVIFGPKPRDYAFSLPKKIERAALRRVLSDRLAANRISVIPDLKIPSGKTKDAAVQLKPFMGEKGALLLVVNEADEFLKRAVRNLKGVKMVRSRDLNVYQLVASKSILITQPAIKTLEERLGK
jgi:large subunit ribosomal protein L4